MKNQLPTAQPTASVLLLCGLPASGKSTFTRKIIDLRRRCFADGRQIASHIGENVRAPISSRFDKIIRIDYDSIARQELTLSNNKNDAHRNQNAGQGASNASFDANDLEAWRKSRVRALEILQEELSDHFAGSGDRRSLLIVMDDNFHLRSMRRDVHRACQELLATKIPSPPPRIGFSTVHFSAPLDVCVRRNDLRSGKERVPVDVIDRMASVMEPPDETKPYASFERFHCSVDTTLNALDGKVLHEIDQCLQKSLQSPIQPKNELSQEEVARLEQQRMQRREETLKCQTQRIDQLLRKLVGAVGRVDKKRSREANEARKSIMERIRTRGDAFDRSDDSVVGYFACSMLGTEINDDWYESGNPLARSMKETFEEFQRHRKDDASESDSNKK